MDEISPGVEMGRTCVGKLGEVTGVQDSTPRSGTCEGTPGESIAHVAYLRSYGS